MEKEKWMPINGYEGQYEVSDKGRIKSLKHNNTWNGKLRKLQKNKDGYYLIGLYKNSNKSFLVHRLVWKAFKGEIPKGMQIDHKDGNKLNNSLTNLRLCTDKENKNNPNTKKRAAKAVAERSRKQFSRPVIQLTKEGEPIETFNSAMDASRHTGINQGSISNCCNNKTKTAGGYIWKYKNNNGED